MHELRIAQLRRRVDVLTAKRADPRFDPAAIERDMARTHYDIAVLDGLRLRNLALDAERPGLEAAKAKIRERKRRIREASQLTIGRRPSPKDLLKGL